MNCYQYSSDFKFPTSFYVDWHLLNGCNHYCDYDHEPDSVINEFFSRENLLLAAYKLLSLNRSKYIFYIYGGECTIHPYLADLLKYLGTSGRNVHILLKTNGFRTINYYKSLIKPIFSKRLKLIIDVHFKYMDLKHLLLLIALMIENGQDCHINLNIVSKFSKKAEVFCENLANFRKTLPFTVSIDFPEGDLPDVWSDTLANCHDSFLLPRAMHRVDNYAQTDIKDAFFCVCTNTVHVAPDGKCDAGLKDHYLPFAPAILHNAVFREGMRDIPAFGTLEEAEKWLEQFNIEALRLELDGGPVRHPLNNKPAHMEICQKIKRIQPVRDDRRVGTAFPAIWRERLSDIIVIHAFLADEPSRQIFLRMLKCCLLGNYSYLEHIPVGEVVALKEAGLRIMRRTDSMGLCEFCSSVAWYENIFELELAKTPDWIDALLAVRSRLPEYRIFLEYNDGKLKSYGLPPIIRNTIRTLPLRSADNQSLLSVIVDCGRATATIQAVKKQLEASPGNYEFIFLLDASSLNYERAEADRLAYQYPWHVRTFHFETRLESGARWNRCLALARGDFLYVMRGGETLYADQVMAAINAMEQDQNIDIVLFSSGVENARIIDMDVREAANFAFSPHRSSIYGRIYRLAAMRELCPLPERYENHVREDFIDFVAYYHSRKILFMPGTAKQGWTKNCVDATDPVGDFMGSMEALALFCEVNRLDFNMPELQAWRTRIFNGIWNQSDREHKRTKPFPAESFLRERGVAILRKNPVILRQMCQKLATGQPVSVLMPEIICALPETASCVAVYGVAANMDFPLSVVIPVSGENDLQWLGEVERQDILLLEWVVIDNASDEKTAMLLEDKASLYPNIRLFRMQSRASEAHCRNEGLLRANGKVVLFATGRDRFKSDFAAQMAKIIDDSRFDTFIFCNRHECGLKSSVDALACENGVQAFSWIIEKGIGLPNLIMARNREQLIREKLLFNPIYPDMDTDFILRCLRAASPVICANDNIISCRISQKKPLKIYAGTLEAANDFYRILDDFMPEGTWPALRSQPVFNLARQNLVDIWLPIYRACLHETNDADELAIPQSDIFIRALVMEFDRVSAESTKACNGCARGVK